MKVLLNHLPPESACADAMRGGKHHWSDEAHLLDDLRMALTNTKKHPAKPHPARPLGGKRLDKKALAAGQRRRAARLRAIEAGDIT